jgi:hypothetical protein
MNVQVRLRSSDIDACGETVRQVFRASITTQRQHGLWLLNAMDARRTSGHAPESDPTACAPATDPVPKEDSAADSDGDTGATSGGCHPSYEGACVPDEGYDVDCGEIDATDLTVVGPDDYRLDADGDGVACES